MLLCRSYLYAFALVPIGVLADRLPRNRLMAAGLASWSALTLLASEARSFGELLTARVGFATAQAVQNPISFALSKLFYCPLNLPKRPTLDMLHVFMASSLCTWLTAHASHCFAEDCLI